MRLPPSARCCLSGMPSSCSACQAHAGAQAGRKRQSSWKTRVRSEPTRSPCQAEQLWPASASASLSCSRRCTADLRRKDATTRGPLVHPGRARGQTPCGGEWAFGAVAPGTAISLVSWFSFSLLMSDLSQSFPKACKVLQWAFFTKTDRNKEQLIALFAEVEN